MIRWIDRDGNVSARAGPINGKSNAEQNRTRAANIKRVIGFSSNRTKFALLNEDRQKFILSQSSNRWPSADQLNQFVGRNRRLRDRRRVSQTIMDQHLRTGCGRLDSKHCCGVGGAAAFSVAALRLDAGGVIGVVNTLKRNAAVESQRHRT